MTTAIVEERIYWGLPFQKTRGHDDGAEAVGAWQTIKGDAKSSHLDL